MRSTCVQCPPVALRHQRSIGDGVEKVLVTGDHDEQRSTANDKGRVTGWWIDAGPEVRFVV